MTHDFFKEQRPHNGMTYQSFMELFKNRLTAIQDGKLAAEAPREAGLLKLNLQRSRRIYQHFQPSPEAASVLSGIQTKQLWMVLTEDWCGDSAQSLPVIARLAELNPLIELRILERDENLDIMDLYLTNGSSRSIPQLVAFNEDGEELFQWGPRPVIAQEDFIQRKNEGVEKEDNNKLLHTWYARDRGQTVAQEVTAVVAKAMSVLVYPVAD